MTSIFDEIKKNPKYNPENSARWFQTNVTNAFKNLGQQQFLNQNKALQSKTIVPGYLYYFGYDPKFKDELPFYDRFPLILPFAMDNTHFTGINLHYLPPPKRIIILDKLIQFAKNKNQPEKMKLELSWKMLMSLSENKAIKYSVKKYLKGHVKTNFISVPMDDWVIACMLPMQRFTRASDTEVWKGSK